MPLGSKPWKWIAYGFLRQDRGIRLRVNVYDLLGCLKMHARVALSRERANRDRGQIVGIHRSVQAKRDRAKEGCIGIFERNVLHIVVPDDGGLRHSEYIPEASQIVLRRVYL